ncbi:hypothetical protein TNCV_3304391 [Trichonephila clavipes]|nr:hypothetical protein TNCV_3304391 [Trichonephila clavipes]
MRITIQTDFVPEEPIVVRTQIEGVGCRSVLLPVRNCRWRNRAPLRGFKETDWKVTGDFCAIPAKISRQPNSAKRPTKTSTLTISGEYGHYEPVADPGERAQQSTISSL